VPRASSGGGGARLCRVGAAAGPRQRSELVELLQPLPFCDDGILDGFDLAVEISSGSTSMTCSSGGGTVGSPSGRARLETGQLGGPDPIAAAIELRARGSSD
jgi:hypothetical protein